MKTFAYRFLLLAFYAASTWAFYENWVGAERVPGHSLLSFAFLTLMVGMNLVAAEEVR